MRASPVQLYVSLAFILVLFCAVLIWDSSTVQGVADGHRALSDGPLQFLTAFLPQKPANKEKPIEFLDIEHVGKSKAPTPVPKSAAKVTEKPLEFLDNHGLINSNKNAGSATNSKTPDPPSVTKQSKPLDLPVKPVGSTIHFKSDVADTKPKPKAKPTTKDEFININNPIKFVNPHPVQSPRNGTDISPMHQMALLKCPNQATCIVPELQLAKKLKVYLCKHPTRHGVRFYYILREGLLMHPNVELVSEEHIPEADFIIYPPGSAPWHLTECTDPSYAPRLIVLDEFDGHQLISPTITPEQYVERYGGKNRPWYFMYFKRSFVRRLDGDFKRYPHFAQPDVYPMTYAIAEAYVPSHFNFQREIDILCTLRGTKAMTTRMRVQTWVAEYGVTRDVKQIVTSQVNTATRTTVSKAYFEQMFNSRIIVTVNPADWEGDFRLWESLCTGALVFVDPIYVPHPFPLVGGEHIVYFDNNNQTELFAKLDYYRANPQEARRIAINGYLYAMKYHRTVNMVDYLLRSAHLKRAMLDKQPLPRYYYSAQYLNYEAAAQEKAMVACKSPGRYAPVPSDHHLTNISYVHPIPRLSCPAHPEAAPSHSKPRASGGNIKFATG